MSPTIELLCGHRSIRHFTDEPVTDAQREAIIAAGAARPVPVFYSAALLSVLPIGRCVRR